MEESHTPMTSSRMGNSIHNSGRTFSIGIQALWISHGKMVLQKAIQILDSSGSAFKGIPIGAKIPGVHWRMAIDRAAELAAGLVRTSSGDLNDDSRGHGYEEIISLFRDVGSLPGAPRILRSTSPA